MNFLWQLTFLITILGATCSADFENMETDSNITDGAMLTKLGRKLNEPMLTLIGMAIENLHPCKEWTKWSQCDVKRRGYFGTRTRTRKCPCKDKVCDMNVTTEADYRLCEGFCPVNYNLTKHGFCLKWNKTKVTHDSAEQKCRKDGGYVVHVDSEEKRDDILRMVYGVCDYIHIDGRRTNSSSPWKYSYGFQDYQGFRVTGLDSYEHCQTLNVCSGGSRHGARCYKPHMVMCEVINKING